MNEIVENTLLGAMLVLCLFTYYYPWHFQSRLSRILVHLPLSLLVLFPIYTAMPFAGVDIRVDLVLLPPLIGAALICYVVKLVRLIYFSLQDAAPAHAAVIPDPSLVSARNKITVIIFWVIAAGIMLPVSAYVVIEVSRMEELNSDTWSMLAIAVIPIFVLGFGVRHCIRMLRADAKKSAAA